MTLFRLRATLIATAVLAIACGRSEQSFPTYSPQEGNPTLLTGEDVAVYEAVISAYAQAGQILLSRFAPSVRGTQPISDQELDRLSAEHGVRMRPYTSKLFTAQPQPNRWYALNDKVVDGVLVGASTVSDFNIRNERRASIRRFHPRHLRVVWSDKVETLTPLFALTLPGYSRSHDEAIVEVSAVTYALAGGGELLYLRRTGNSWHVVAKQQAWIS